MQIRIFGNCKTVSCRANAFWPFVTEWRLSWEKRTDGFCGPRMSNSWRTSFQGSACRCSSPTDIRSYGVPLFIVTYEEIIPRRQILGLSACRFLRAFHPPIWTFRYENCRAVMFLMFALMRRECVISLIKFLSVVCILAIDGRFESSNRFNENLSCVDLIITFFYV